MIKNFTKSFRYLFRPMAFLACLLFFLPPSFGQTPSTPRPAASSTAPADSVFFDFGKDIAGQLLPFDDLLKLAVANSPLVKYEGQIAETQDAIQRLSKLQIFQYTNGFANYSSGNQAIFSTTYQGADLLGQIANGYRFGVNFQVSLYDLVGRRQQVRQYKSNYKAAVLRQETVELQVRRELINVYQDLLTSQRILRVRLDDEEVSLSALRVAEVELQQRKIEPNDFANVSNRYTISRSSSEEARGELFKNFYQLQALVGVPLDRLKRN